MNPGLNVAYLIGTLAADPDLRHTALGKPLCKLIIETRGTPPAEEADRHRVNVNAVGREAEHIAAHAKRGWRIAVECVVKPRSWVAKDGSTRYATDLEVQRVLWIAGPGKSAHSTPTE